MFTHQWMKVGMKLCDFCLFSSFGFCVLMTCSIYLNWQHSGVNNESDTLTLHILVFMFLHMPILLFHCILGIVLVDNYFVQTKVWNCWNSCWAEFWSSFSNNLWIQSSWYESIHPAHIFSFFQFSWINVLTL